MEHRAFFAALAARFRPDEVRSRTQSGRPVPYVTARVVMNRLDEVAGPAGWWDEYTPIDNAVVCKLTIRTPDGSTITKCDAGGCSQTSDSSDVEKSGFSDAFKRAAVKFGVGRYLYGDGVPNYAESEAERDDERKSASKPETRREPAGRRGDAAGTPRTGRDLYGWCRDLGCLDRAEMLGRAAGYPARVVDWTPDQADAVHRQLTRESSRRSRRRAEAGAASEN